MRSITACICIMKEKTAHTVWMPPYGAGERGFLQAYIVYLLLVIAAFTELLTVRYLTLAEYQHTSRNSSFCELYILHYLTNRTTEESDGEEDMDTTEEPVYLEASNCSVQLIYKEREVHAVYTADGFQHEMRILLDEEGKEILDTAYENGFWSD